MTECVGDQRNQFGAVLVYGPIPLTPSKVTAMPSRNFILEYTTPVRVFVSAHRTCVYLYMLMGRSECRVQL